MNASSKTGVDEYRCHGKQLDSTPARPPLTHTDTALQLFAIGDVGNVLFYIASFKLCRVVLLSSSGARVTWTQAYHGNKMVSNVVAVR